MSDRTALLLGPTGGIGRTVGLKMVAAGWNVRALHRAPERFPAGDRFEWVKGDALIREDVVRAAQGASVIVHAAKPREYGDWHTGVLPMVDNVIAAADGARIVVPGNVYNYGPDAGDLISEDAPQHASTRKGRLRIEMERRLENAVAAGHARALIVRAADFFGPGAGSSWFSQAMVKPGRHPKVIRNPATKGVGHQWTYLPDLGDTMVSLINRTDLEPFARFHMDGHWDPDGTAMASAIKAALGAPEPSIRPLPWWLMAAAAPFVPAVREFTELRYLWQRPVRLDNRRLLETLGVEPHTPLDRAVRDTLVDMGLIKAANVQSSK